MNPLPKPSQHLTKEELERLNELTSQQYKPKYGPDTPNSTNPFNSQRDCSLQKKLYE